MRIGPHYTVAGDLQRLPASVNLIFELTLQHCETGAASDCTESIVVYYFDRLASARACVDQKCMQNGKREGGYVRE